MIAPEPLLLLLHSPRKTIVVELLHELPLGAQGVEQLQEQRPQQLLLRDRELARARVERIERRRQRAADLFDYVPARTERMIRGDTLLGGAVPEDRHLLSVVTAHGQRLARPTSHARAHWIPRVLASDRGRVSSATPLGFRNEPDKDVSVTVL